MALTSTYGPVCIGDGLQSLPLLWLSKWNIWYAEWMIGDGLPNRRVGEEFSWELDFYPKEPLTIAAERRKTAVPIPDYRYSVVAELVCLSEQARVIDFGLKAVGDADLIAPGCCVGDYVSGELGLFNAWARLTSRKNARICKSQMESNRNIGRHHALYFAAGQSQILPNSFSATSRESLSSCADHVRADNLCSPLLRNSVAPGF